MDIDQNGIQLIEKHEGCVLHPYKDERGIATIGFGSTYYENGTHVQLTDPVITKDRAVELMMHKLNTEFAPQVNKLITVPLTQNQFDSLMDFAYNAGVGHLAGSTLLKKINAKDYSGAADEFEKWIFAGGVISAGLKSRRDDEKALFLKADDIKETAPVIVAHDDKPVEAVVQPVVPVQEPQKTGFISLILGMIAGLFGK